MAHSKLKNERNARKSRAQCEVTPRAILKKHYWDETHPVSAVYGSQPQILCIIEARQAIVKKPRLASLFENEVFL